MSVPRPRTDPPAPRAHGGVDPTPAHRSVGADDLGGDTTHPSYPRAYAGAGRVRGTTETIPHAT